VRAAEAAEGKSSRETVLAPHEQISFQLELWGHLLLLHAFQPALDDIEIDKGQVQVEAGDLLAQQDRVRWLVEPIEHFDQSIDDLDVLQEFVSSRRVLLPRRHSRNVDELSGRRCRLLGMEDASKKRKVFILNRDRCEIRLGLGNLHGPVTQRGKQRGFPRLREADDTDLHGRDSLAPVNSCLCGVVQYTGVVGGMQGRTTPDRRTVWPTLGGRMSASALLALYATVDMFPCGHTLNLLEMLKE
jgi:hypothetical protein